MMSASSFLTGLHGNTLVEFWQSVKKVELPMFDRDDPACLIVRAELYLYWIHKCICWEPNNDKVLDLAAGSVRRNQIERGREQMILFLKYANSLNIYASL